LTHEAAENCGTDETAVPCKIDAAVGIHRQSSLISLLSGERFGVAATSGDTV
jgi:hypothetical protein